MRFEISQKIKATKQIDVETIKSFIKEKLNKSCKYKTVSDSGNSMKVDGAVSENLFTPMTRFAATFTIKTEGDKARLDIEGTPYPSLVFWIFILIGFFTWGSFLCIGIILFLIQMNKPRKALEDILKFLDTEYGVL